MPGYGEQVAQDLLVGSDTIMYNNPPMDIRVVEQIVPSRVCFTCDVCCRFPERDSPLRPYFTREEIQAAIARGISPEDRKSTRLNSSHLVISYAVFCLKKK